MEVSTFQRALCFNGVELGTEDVSLLELQALPTEYCIHYRTASERDLSPHLLCHCCRLSCGCLRENVCQWCSLLNRTHLFTELASSCLAVEYARRPILLRSCQQRTVRRVSHTVEGIVLPSSI